MKKRKTNFRIAHGTPEYTPFGTIEAGPIGVVHTNRQDSGAIPYQRGRISKGKDGKGKIVHEPREGTRRYSATAGKVTKESEECGFPLAFQFATPYLDNKGVGQVRKGKTYLQRHGTAYRLDKLLSSGVLDALLTQAQQRKKK